MKIRPWKFSKYMKSNDFNGPARSIFGGASSRITKIDFNLGKEQRYIKEIRRMQRVSAEAITA